MNLLIEVIRSVIMKAKTNGAHLLVKQNYTL